MISIRYRGFRASIVALVIVGVFTGCARHAHAGIMAMNFEIYCHATAAGPRYFHSAISKMVVNSDHFSLWRSLGSSRILDRILDEHAVEFARGVAARHDVDRLLSPRCELVAPGRGAPAIAAAAYFRGGERVSYPANWKIGVEWAPPDFRGILESSSHVAWPRVVALVVGNSGYAHIPPLPNPAGDAADVAEALGRLGFDVRLLLDADKAAMDDALAAFETASEGAEVALVFYSGHGLERDGSRFVLPIDAQPRPGFGSDEASGRSVPLDDIIAATAQAQARVVILDAMFSQDSSGMEVLERIRPSPDTQWGMNLLVAYAGLPGGFVFDGDGTTSPYAEALLRRLNEQPILSVLAMFGAVGADVFELTEGRQLPSIFSTLTAPVTLQRPEPNLLDAERTSSEVMELLSNR